MKKTKILFVGGGTGGHIYPLLAINEYLQEHKNFSPSDVHFIIANNNSDYHYFENLPFSYTTVSVAKLRRYFSWENFLDFFIFIKNIFSAFWFLLFHRPEKIFSKGGFVSLPFGISAFFLRIPFFLHETDSAMGLSNSILSRIATKIFTGFPSKNSQYIFTGNPVRKDFFTIPQKQNFQEKDADEKKKFTKKLQILIFGGSQGAEKINEWARIFFSSEENKKNEVLLITGKGKKSDKKIENITEKEFLTHDFISEIHKADIVITRAGGSISELAAAQKCTILIPLPSAANNHQRKNAQYFSEKKAALYLEESELFSDESVKKIEQLFSSASLQEQYKKNISSLSQPLAIENICKFL